MLIPLQRSIGVIVLVFFSVSVVNAVDLSEIDPSDPETGKSHWAFRSLTTANPPAIPPAEGTIGGKMPPLRDGTKSAIDAFVVARLTAENLHPVADAERGFLLRRVYFQLIGLPPSLEETQAFGADERPDALERVVDQLLASPHFGERWGRHWLDLARYSDSNGLDENFLFREAWRYRNWVIDAVNQGIPFNRFVLEQIAGDLLPYDSISQRDQQRIAAGFLVLGPKVLLGNNEKNQRMEVADELIDTIGRAILGQTLGCCRCHDHKFDPVPTADYYALAGIFTSTSVMETRYMLGEQRRMEQLVGLGSTGSELDDDYEKYWREQPKLAERKKQAEAALEAIKQDKPEALADVIAKHAEAVAADARSSEEAPKTREQRVAAQEALIAEIAHKLANPPKIPPRAMIPVDVAQPSDEHIRLAGQFDRLGKLVPRGFLTVLCEDERTMLPPQQSGRIALAEWLTNGELRSGQLAARVLANRVWHHLIGRGLVRTVDNFGRTGEEPSHPELLDYLARDLIGSGWSLKKLIREIATSRTFGLSSEFDPANHSADPENQWLWRANRRRLDPEAYRDSMLSIAGTLDVSPMESTVWYLGDQATAVGANLVRRRTDFPCRSVYLPVIRNDLPELFEVFDFANPHFSTGARPNTTAPGQGLFMLNDLMVMDAAAATAKRILAQVTSSDPDAKIDALYRHIFNQETPEELRQPLRSFLLQSEERFTQENNQPAATDTAAAGAGESPQQKALALTCQALFASSQFQFLD